MLGKILRNIRPRHQSRPDPPSETCPVLREVKSEKNYQNKISSDSNDDVHGMRRNHEELTKKQRHQYQDQVSHDVSSSNRRINNTSEHRRPDPPIKIPAYRDRYMKVNSNRNTRDAGSINSAPALLKSPNDCVSVQSDPAFDGSRRSSFKGSKFGSIPEANNRPKMNKKKPAGYDKSRDMEEATLATLSSYERLKKPKSPTEVPEGDVTIVFTDVQGSTSMWEANHVAMKEALDLHDSIVRKCYSNLNGYEITTEGDAFQLAFKHPLDAFKFAMRCQIDLYRANWSSEILSLKEAADLENGTFRGFRVRIAIHHGPTRSKFHDMTGRIYYEGATVGITKAVEKMCHGGQILTTMETWRAVSGMAERQLGSPQVLDCGEHLLLRSKKKDSNTSTISKQILQLLPRKFAYDYFTARGRRPSDSRNKKDAIIGRKFPPLITKGQTSASFYDAPYSNGKVTIVFINTVNRDDENLSDRVKEKNSTKLAKIIRSVLIIGDNPGYECQEDKGSWMLAFHRIVDGVSFGLNLQERIESAPLHVKVGIHSGPFTSMGPHAVTGRADYFGPIVNRAARVTSATESNNVFVGMAVESGEVIVPPDFGSFIHLKFVAKQQLKGVTTDMALFSCSRITKQ